MESTCTIVHQTKDLHTTDYTQLYDFLKYNQKEVDDQRAERLAKTHDPLALMANSNNPFNYPVFHQDQPSPSTYMQQPQPINNNYNPQPSFNHNYMQQPRAKSRRTSQIPQAQWNMHSQMRWLEPMWESFSTICCGKNRLVSKTVRRGGVQVRADDEVERCGVARAGVDVGTKDYRVAGLGVLRQLHEKRGLGHLARNCTVRPRRRDAAYLQTQLLIAQKEEAGIQLQAEEFDFRWLLLQTLMKLRKSNANCIFMANFSKQSTSGVEQEGGTVDQHPATVEETRAYFESLYNNLALEVEKINALHLSSGKQITTLNEEISNLSKQLSMEKSTVSSLLEEKKKLKSDFKIREDELL
ncbi:hypothetical protein Tco_0546232 [Tanacetum coccineum]